MHLLISALGVQDMKFRFGEVTCRRHWTSNELGKVDLKQNIYFSDVQSYVILLLFLELV